MYLQDPFTNWANFLYVSCTRVVLYVYQISGLYYFFFLVFAEKCHENWLDTFFKNFCRPEFSRYLNKTPFSHAYVSKVSWKKNSWQSDQPVFKNRATITKSPFCDIMKTKWKPVMKTVLKIAGKQFQPVCENHFFISISVFL